MTEEAPRDANPQHPPVEGAETELGDAREHEELAKLARDAESARAERDEAREKLARTLADFDNFRRRTRGEAQAAREKGKEEVLRGLLDVLDNFDRALAAAPEGPLADGVRLIHRQLSSLLEREGLARIDAVGQAFDPAMHEAVASVPAEGGAKPGTVVEEVARGYTFAGRVLRPARVKVAASS